MKSKNWIYIFTISQADNVSFGEVLKPQVDCFSEHENVYGDEWKLHLINGSLPEEVSKPLKEFSSNLRGIELRSMMNSHRMSQVLRLDTEGFRVTREELSSIVQAVDNIDEWVKERKFYK